MHTRSRFPASFLPCLALGLLASACSKGGGGAPPIRQFDVSATASRLTADPTTNLIADGVTVSQITVVVVDTAGSPMANQRVVLDVSGTGNVLAPTSGDSNAQGEFRATLASTSAERKAIVARVNPASPAPVTLVQTAEVVFVTPDTPLLAGSPRYEDTNRNGSADQGDRMTLAFTVPVLVVTSRPEDLALPVAGDSLGTGAAIAAGPTASEVTVTLGANPVLRTRGAFDASALTANSPSGIDVAATVQGIVSASTRTPAAPSTALDLVPALHADAVATAVADATACASGDFDNDGDVDVWVGGSAADRLFLRDASGALQETLQFGNQPTRAVLVADLDRLGGVDIVTLHDGSAQIWRNTTTTGTPNIVQGQEVFAPQPRAALIADVDGDAFRDLVVGGASDVRVFRHQRNLGVTMNLAQTIPLADVRALVAGDVDGDGDVDVVAGTGAGLRLLRNNGGTLALSTLDALAAPSVALGDVDADGDLDVVASDGTTARLLRSDGNGQFTGQSLAIPAQRVALRDLDGDARADLVTIEADAIATHFAGGSGSGSTFARDGQRIAEAARSLELGDFEGDGDVDLLAVLATGLSARTGSLRGTFGTTTLANLALIAPRVTRATAQGDLDGDGDVDLVVGGDGDDLVLLNDGAGNFTFSGLARHRLNAGSTSALGVADMDGDGDLDVVNVERLVTGVTSRWRVWFNDGSGGFPETRDLPHAQTDDAQALALGDVTGDGLADVVVGCTAANLVFRNVLFNGVRTFFQAPNPFPGVTTQRDTRALALHDIDEDGDLDLVAGNFGSAQFGEPNQVFRLTISNALPTFSELALVNGQATVAVAVLDVDRDGLLDLIAASGGDSATNRIQVDSFGRRTTQIVGTPVRSASNSPATSMALGDIDGDGRVDLLVGTTDGKLQVWRQTGPKQFTVVQELLIDDIRALAAFDTDRDGDVEGFAATGASDVVLRNR